MLTAAFYVLAATVVAGLGLSCFYLLERPIRGPARLASWAHGMAGAVGFGLLAFAPWAARGNEGFGRIAAGLVLVTLLAGLAILAFQRRRRRPPGVVIALHATLGVAGLVILAAYMSTIR